ncbi:FecR domain-containing protein [Parapedobacter lycopersici]|uniref:FecR family protein n=1 Tax=Parapedobacter lycopersici TaxID=1864939 RepID=UPI00333FFA41
MKYHMDHIQELLIEKLAGTISDQDNLHLDSALERDYPTQLLWKAMSDQFEAAEGEHFLNNLNEHHAWLHIVKKIGEDTQVSRTDKRKALITGFNLKKIAAAAALLLVIGISGYLWLNSNAQRLPAISGVRPSYPTENPHRGDQAVLTLSNGESIILDSVETGVLVKTGNIEVSKTADGQLIYAVSRGGINENPAGLNTITTPIGGQYQLMLPDGSKVWLNTASSLKFPNIFRGERREVELIGEAYFQVKKNAEMPFIVKSKRGEIEVLGTGFNVMAYEEEPQMKTTLIEGSVKVKGRETMVLKPGEQAISNGQKTRIVRVDVNEATAWKSNMFQFNDTPVESVMREASRWYNVDVIYNGKIPARSFTGKISREVRIDEFLEMLSYLGVRFKVEGKRVIVL